MTVDIPKKLFVTLLLLMTPALVSAADTPTLNMANTAWMLTSSVLVLFMTIPGLALFYAGLVRAKNVLSVLMQCFALTCMVSIVWVLLAYSLAFTDGGASNAWLGGTSKALMAGIGVDTLKRRHPGNRVCHVSDDLRNHHAGARGRSVCRAHEVFRHDALQPVLAAARLRTDMPLGVGRRLASENGRAGFRGWDRGAH